MYEVPDEIPCCARIAARGLWGADCSTRIAARGLRQTAHHGVRLAAHGAARGTRGSLRRGTARFARRAARWAVVTASNCGLRRDLRRRAGVGPAAAHIMRASSRRSSAPARPGGPWTAGSESCRGSVPSLSCPAPLPPSPVHLHTPNLFQLAE